jgi:hypothetical protein
MTAVSPGDSTIVFIRKKIRRLTSSASESALSTSQIDEYINNFYASDFPYGIKLDQMRSVYTFFTEPYRDRYPLDVNFNQGVRGPVYVEGILGTLFKDRQQFLNLWPRWPTLFHPISGDGNETKFTFTIPAPFLSKEVVLGGVDKNGNPISVNDDGNGNLQLQVPNPIVTVPPYTDVYTIANAPNPSLVGKPIPGMHNSNTLNPGLNNTSTTTGLFTNGIGTVDYVTGVFNIEFPVAPASGTKITLWVSQYQTGRPYCLLFWNNEFTIRPVPKLIHKVEVETYLTPVQFMESTDTPILAQWAQYIAYGVSCEIQRDRNDFDSVAALQEGFKRQEALVLERQGIEEIFTPNYQLFNSTQGYSVYGGWGGYGSGGL